MMERRKFVKALLPLATLFSFKGAFGFQTRSANLLEDHERLAPVPWGTRRYKGKILIVTEPLGLEVAFKRRGGMRLPRFKSDKGILDELRRFVDMGEGHMDEIGNEVYGCVHGDESYSIASFAPPHGHPKEYRILLKAKQT